MQADYRPVHYNYMPSHMYMQHSANYRTRPYWVWSTQQVANWQHTQAVPAQAAKEGPVDEGVALAKGIL